jgi:hypothetical protein
LVYLAIDEEIASTKQANITPDDRREAEAAQRFSARKKLRPEDNYTIDNSFRSWRDPRTRIMFAER